MRFIHWNTFLLLIYTLLKECPAEDQVITSETVEARLGEQASLTCRVREDVNVFQVQWSRCLNQPILVFHVDQGVHFNNMSYENHSSVQLDTLTLNRVQEDDFGDYCCKLTTYPSGSLVGRIHLLQKAEDEDPLKKSNTTMARPTALQPAAGLPVMMIVYIGCGAVGSVVLMGIVICLLSRTHRRKLRNPNYIQNTGPLSQNPHTSDPHQKGEPANRFHMEDDDDGMYLNVPDSGPRQP